MDFFAIHYREAEEAKEQDTLTGIETGTIPLLN